MRSTFSLALASLLTTLHALTITYPTAGSTIDPSQPITVRWTSTASDPQSFNLVVLSDSSSVFTFGDDGTTQVGTNVRTSSGSYTIPANTIAAFGAGFTISARTTTGDQLASSGSFLLGYGASQVVTGDNGQVSLLPAPTAGAPAQTTLSSLTFDTSGLEGQSVTATYFPGTVGSGTVTGTQASGTLTSLVFPTSGVTGNMTIMSSSSSTRHSSSASSSTMRASTSASSSASSAATTNAQVRLSAGKEVMGLAGLVAGLFALIA